MFGPVSQYHQNSAFYSAIPPARDHVTDLMPITVQMPVYKVRLTLLHRATELTSRNPWNRSLCPPSNLSKKQ